MDFILWWVGKDMSKGIIWRNSKASMWRSGKVQFLQINLWSGWHLLPVLYNQSRWGCTTPSNLFLSGISEPETFVKFCRGKSNFCMSSSENTQWSNSTLSYISFPSTSWFQNYVEIFLISNNDRKGYSGHYPTEND